jgi:hypothetical protein
VEAKVVRVEVGGEYSRDDQGRLEQMGDLKMTGDLFFRAERFELAFDRYRTGLNVAKNVGVDRLP